MRPAFCVVAVALFGCAAEDGVIDPANYALDGLTWGASPEAVLEVWGPPTEVVRHRLGERSHRFEKRSAFFIDTDSGELSALTISTERSGDCLAGRVCIGDTLDGARSALGPAELHAATSDKPALLEYLAPHEPTCWLWVFSEDEVRVSELRLACQP